MTTDQEAMIRKTRTHDRRPRTYRVRVDPAGRIVLPSELRAELAIGSGDELLLRQECGGIRLESFARALREAQEYFATAATSAMEADGSVRD